MEIKEIIKEARTKAGLTQEQAAEQLFVTRQTISNWENGRSLPDIISVLKISDWMMFGVTGAMFLIGVLHIGTIFNENHKYNVLMFIVGIGYVAFSIIATIWIVVLYKKHAIGSEASQQQI